MSRNIAALVAGLIFGFGLAVSRMVEPAKVIGFLDVAGRWDPSLLLVMAGAVGVMFVAYRLIVRRPKPLLAAQFTLPSKLEIDRPLLLGAAIFGVGWGLAGYCPGPGIAALGLGTWEAPVFVAALAAGALAHRWLFERAAPDTGAAASEG
ncbi:MAG TPA: DUF6691 family protein [Burkholderiales bacterium]